MDIGDPATFLTARRRRIVGMDFRDIKVCASRAYFDNDAGSFYELHSSVAFLVRIAVIISRHDSRCR